MQFEQMKRREFITLLGGVADTRPLRFGPRRCRSPQGLYVLLARRPPRSPALAQTLAFAAWPEIETNEIGRSRR
jgi:hypothetical protein